jgi:hypothetical protein
LMRWLKLKQQSKSLEQSVRPTDISMLPPIESLTSESDLTVFLRPGVPADLLKAALQQAWRSDPAIRDFVGIAESQWDFNDPTAMPGFGLLDPIEEGQNVVKRSSVSAADAPGVTADPPQDFNPHRDGQLDRVWASGGQVRHDSGPLEPEIGPSPTNSSTLAADRPRRHGSALPKLS